MTQGLTNVNDSIENVCKLLGQQLYVHNIKVKKELHPNLPGILIDPIRLEQVFINLINNARHVLEESGHKDLKIEIKSDLNHKNEVNISIKDNGGGIPKEVQDHIFDSFFTTKQAGMRTRLGLSISKGIIEEAGGRIELEVEDGIATTFLIILPPKPN